MKEAPTSAAPLEGPRAREAFELAKNQSPPVRLAKICPSQPNTSPSWGRLHLNMGEALVYAGKKDEAP
jgi:hypothetical protein